MKRPNVACFGTVVVGDLIALRVQYAALLRATVNIDA